MVGEGIWDIYYNDITDIAKIMFSEKHLKEGIKITLYILVYECLISKGLSFRGFFYWQRLAKAESGWSRDK